MAVKRYKPITPGTRFKTVSSFEEVTKSRPEKSLLVAIRHTAGRNHYGRITVRQRGGGNKTKYRIIDFKRNKDDVPAKVAAIEYDPNRTAYIALLHYADGEKRYILAPLGLTVGDTVVSGSRPTSRRATASLCRISPSVLSCITSKCSPAKAARSPRRQAPPHSLWQKKASTRPSSSPAAK